MGGAVLIEVDAKTCADSGGPDWEALRDDEEKNLLGGAGVPLPSKWDVGIRDRLEKLWTSHGGGHENCPFLSHADLSCSVRRRRYWMEGKKLGEGFLGRRGMYSELARQRNLLYLNIQRCKCRGAAEGETCCMSSGFRGVGNNSGGATSVEIDVH